jgi:hypothetical protein
LVYVLEPTPFSGILKDGAVAELAGFGQDTRPTRQEAMLMYCDPNGKNRGDLAEFVAAAFEFPVPLPGVPREVVARCTTHFFPRWSVDEIYRYLLSLPSYAPDPAEPLNIERMIALPCYVDGNNELQDKDLLSSYIALSRFISPTWFFLNILAPPETDSSTDRSSPSETGLTVWALEPPTCNLIVADISVWDFPLIQYPMEFLLEFSPLEVLARIPGLNSRDFDVAFKENGREKSALHRVNGCSDLRAIWISKGEHEGRSGYWYQAFFGFTSDSLRSSRRLFLNLPGDWSPMIENRAEEGREFQRDQFLLRYALSLFLTGQSGILDIESESPTGASWTYCKVGYKLS